MTSLICRRFGGIITCQLNVAARHRYVSTGQILCEAIKSKVSEKNLDKKEPTEKSVDKKKIAEKYRDNARTQVKAYAFIRFFDYVQSYDKILEKKFPSAMHVYRVFLLGVKEFYSDMKKFLKITRIVNGSSLGMRALTRKEIELYHQMPKDMLKVAPVLIISALPFANYVVFPLAYMYPKYFLTSHFWSLQQKIEFQETFLKERIIYNKKVLRCLQSLLTNVKADDTLYDSWKRILGLLGSGLHPSIDDIMGCNEIFKNGPYHLDNLSTKHLKYLCRVHGIHRGVLKRIRLAEHSFIVHHMDLAIKREGGVHNMPQDAMRDACFIRGLNTNNLSNEHIIKWLEDWVTVSLRVDGTNISLLLHLPILIGYNHPNNWKLIYTDNKK